MRKEKSITKFKADIKIGSIDNDLFFIIGKPDWEKVSKMYRHPEKFIDYIKEHEIITDNDFEGLTFNYQQDFFVVMNEFKNDWFYWDTLIHELHHVIYMLFKKLEYDEMEFMAYTHNHILRELRTKILKKFK